MINFDAILRLGTYRGVVTSCCRIENEFNFMRVNVYTGCPKGFLTDRVKYFTVITFISILFLLATVGNTVVTVCLVSNSCCVLTSNFCKRLAVQHSCVSLELEYNLDNTVYGKSCLPPPKDTQYTICR
jgi:hypothetical protein